MAVKSKKEKQAAPLKVRFSMSVSGKVQGVGYRFFARERALFRGITGWVQNSYSGNVEIEAQGSPEQLEAYINELWEGPLFGSVADIQNHPIPLVENESSFMVRL
jgi:acylphosphatase